MKFRWTLSLLFATGASLSCTSKSPDATTSGVEMAASDTVECAGDASPFPVDPFEPNLSKAGTGSVLTFTVVSSDPAPPEVGLNTLVIKVAHADGTPFNGSVVIPNEGLWMPLHGHGPTIPPVVGYDAATNTFPITSVDFFMTGLWRLTLQGYEAADASAPTGDEEDDPDAGPAAPAGPTDVGIFYFCL